MNAEEFKVIEQMYKIQDQAGSRIDRKSWIAEKAQFNMAVIRMQEREKEREETERLVQGLKEMGFEET